jgi:protein-L-isoaspartate(D-aspartate) O-methyltransferase
MAALPSVWLDCLTQGGRMMLPLTGSNGSGFTFLIRKGADEGSWPVKLESFVRFYPCIGLRDPSDMAALDAALIDGRASFVAALRRDRHEAEPHCWLHKEDWCLTTRSVGNYPTV